MPVYGTLVWVGAALLGGAVVGCLVPARGRRPAALRWRGVLLAGLALRVLVEVAEVPGGVVLLLASHALLLAGLGANLAWTGTPIVMVGLAASALAVSLNGGAPVSPDALASVGRTAWADPAGALPGERHLEVPRDRLVVLGDILPVPLTRHVTSFGELIAIVGLANVAFNATARRPARRRPPTAEGELAHPAAAAARATPWGAAEGSAAMERGVAEHRGDGGGGR